MATALHVSHVAKAFGGVPVLRDISFDLHPGELTVLAGENGAGKSTLMKIITGQLRDRYCDGYRRAFAALHRGCRISSPA